MAFGLPVAPGKGGISGLGGTGILEVDGGGVKTLPFFDIRLFGAVGNMVADDAPAINAAITAANAAGGVVFVPNTTLGGFRVNSAIVVPSGTIILGEASAGAPGTTRSVIKAGAAMSAVLVIQASNAATLPTGVSVSNIWVDTNNGLAKSGIDIQGALYSYFDNVNVKGANGVAQAGGALDCWKLSSHSHPLIIGAVTAGGGAAANQITLSQPDPGYNNCGVAPGTNIVIKFVNAGGYNVGQFVVSQDGGVTFATARQTVYALCDILFASAATFQSASGIRAAFANVNFQVNWTYSFNATSQGEQGANATTLNALMRFKECTFQSCGVAYTSSNTLRAQASNVIPQAFQLGGTASPTVNQQRIPFTGVTLLTSATSYTPRPGDMLALAGSGVVQVLGVEDGAIYVTAGDASKLTTLAGIDYVVSVGAGFFVNDVGDNIGILWDGGYGVQVPTGWRLSGTTFGGINLKNIFLETPSLTCGVASGGVSAPCGEIVIEDAYVKVPVGTAGQVTYYQQQGTTVEIIRPKYPVGVVDLGGGPGFVAADFSGSQFSLPIAGGSVADYIPKGSLSLQPNFVQLAGGNQVISAPAGAPGSSPTSLTVLDPNASDILGITNTPILQAPLRPGDIWVIENYPASGHVIQFFDEGTTGFTNVFLDGTDSVVIFPGERLVLEAAFIGGVVGKWMMLGISRSARGPSGFGSNCAPDNGPRGYTVVVGGGAPVTTNVVLWDTVFMPTHGMQLQGWVTARDSGSTNFAMWSNCWCIVDATGAILGQSIPATIAAGAGGSNAGLPPAGYSAQFAVVSIAGNNQVALQVTLPTGISGKCLGGAAIRAAFPY